jgi:hypothetical protein
MPCALLVMLRHVSELLSATALSASQTSSAYVAASWRPSSLLAAVVQIIMIKIIIVIHMLAMMKLLLMGGGAALQQLARRCMLRSLARGAVQQRACVGRRCGTQKTRCAA